MYCELHIAHRKYVRRNTSMLFRTTLVVTLPRGRLDCSREEQDQYPQLDEQEAF